MLGAGDGAGIAQCASVRIQDDRSRGRGRVPKKKGGRIESSSRRGGKRARDGRREESSRHLTRNDEFEDLETATSSSSDHRERRREARLRHPRRRRAGKPSSARTPRRCALPSRGEDEAADGWTGCIASSRFPDELARSPRPNPSDDTKQKSSPSRNARKEPITAPDKPGFSVNRSRADLLDAIRRSEWAGHGRDTQRHEARDGYHEGNVHAAGLRGLDTTSTSEHLLRNPRAAYAPRRC